MRGAMIFIVGGVLGLLGGFAAGIFVYPYIFLADVVAAERLGEAEAGPLVAKGRFIHADPDDPIHYGAGGVRLHESVLHLEADFEVGPGPKFHVYLVPAAEIRRSADVAGAMFVDLGRLKAFKGSQNYPLPAGLKLREYRSVVIWCEKFGVLISPASLAFEG